MWMVRASIHWTFQQRTRGGKLLFSHFHWQCMCCVEYAPYQAHIKADSVSLCLYRPAYDYNNKKTIYIVNNELNTFAVYIKRLNEYFRYKQSIWSRLV